MKVAQRDELKEKQRLKKEGMSTDAVENTERVGSRVNNASDSDDDLFGDDDGLDMD